MSVKGGFTIIDLEDILRNKKTINEEELTFYYKGLYDTLEKAIGYGKPIYINGFSIVEDNNDLIVIPSITKIVQSSDGLLLVFDTLHENQLIQLGLLVSQDDTFTTVGN